MGHTVINQAQMLCGNVPKSLLTCNQWVAWSYKNRGSKLGKIPLDPKTGNYAKVNDKNTWGSFNEALGYMKHKKADGIGFVFSTEDSFVGIDLDGCRDPETGEIQDWAEAIIKEIGSYTEISPSGKGLHIILAGKLPGEGKRVGNIEVYDKLRFFTITGNRLSGTPSEILNCQEQLEALYQRITASKQTKIEDVAEKDIITKAFEAENGEKFKRLWEGNYTGYQSKSEADLALCEMLAFWVNNDAQQIDRLFRKSGLYREKWDEKHYANGTTYGEVTIKKAIVLASNSLRGADNNPSVQKLSEQRFKLTDLGNAERLVALHGNDLRYCHAWKSWLIWDGVRWVVDRSNKVKLKAKETVRRIYLEASQADERDRIEIARHATKSESEGRINAMISLAQSEPGIPIDPEELDKDPYLLTCVNGTIDLRTGQLLTHKRENLITQLAPVIYDPEAKCELWIRFLDRIMDGNENLISFLQKVVGYSLTGDTTEQCLFILYGTGANGKSTFLQAISSILGDYAKQTPVETLLVKKHLGGIPNDVARLKGARMVMASEAESGQRIAESLIKQMTGGDKLTARFLHQEWFEFLPTHKIFLATNHKPIIAGTDTAIWRRIRLIPFEITIPENERDRHLSKKLNRELSGIFNWALEGCLKWQNEGLGFPDEVRTATENYRDEMDVLNDFINDCCILHENAKVKSKDLYDEYIEWCERNGEKALSKRGFALKLKEKNFMPARIGPQRARGWTGLAFWTRGVDGGSRTQLC